MYKLANLALVCINFISMTEFLWLAEGVEVDLCDNESSLPTDTVCAFALLQAWVFSVCVFISCNGHKDCVQNIKRVINSSDGIHALS